jgi:hypothetical protein
MTQQYKVTIQGPGLSVEMTDVPKAICDKITVLILTGGAAIPAGPLGAETIRTPVGAAGATGSHAALSSNPELSLREFLDELEPKRGPDKITAIGLYLKDHHSQDTFSSADLEQGFQEASEPVPSNMPRDIKWTVKTGWIAPARDAKGRYYVTKTGSSAAQKKFSKDVVKKTRLAGGRKTAKKAANPDSGS